MCNRSCFSKQVFDPIHSTNEIEFNNAAKVKNIWIFPNYRHIKKQGFNYFFDGALEIKRYLKKQNNRTYDKTADVRLSFAHFIKQKSSITCVYLPT